MDRALRTAPTGYVFFLDSDCVVRKGGFLERMLSAAEEQPARYAVGKKILLNDRGYEVPAGGHEYIRPICMLVKRTPYLSLPPFERHGAPCLANMSAAVQRGFVLVNFPIDEFVDHEGRGTAGRFGYRLGLRGRVNHVLNKFGL